MTTTVYRSHLRAGWIVQSDLSKPFRIDQGALATLCRHCQGRLAAISPESIVVSAECLAQEGDIPLVIADLTSGPQADAVFVGLSNDSWMVVRLAVIRALADVAPDD
jgi:hypothetical protein